MTAVALLALLLSTAAPTALAGNKNKPMKHELGKGYFWEINSEDFSAGYADIMICQGAHTPAVDGKQGKADGVHMIALVSDYKSGEFQEVKIPLEDSQASSKNLRSGRLNVKTPVKFADSTKQLTVDLSWKCGQPARKSPGYRSPRSIFWFEGDLKLTACSGQKVTGKVFLGADEFPVRNVFGGSFESADLTVNI